MKVKELIRQNTDIDVFDDVCDALAIAFCGPANLTEDGYQHFSEMLEYEVSLTAPGVAVVHVDAEEGEWQRRLSLTKEFFHAAAGYCSEQDYARWFK